MRAPQNAQAAMDSVSSEGDEPRNRLIEAVTSLVESAQRLGKRAELEARLGSWNASTCAFRPGIHLRTLGEVQRVLDSFVGWEGKTGWMHSRDSFYRTKDGANLGRGPQAPFGDRVVRCELNSDGTVRNTWKRKLGKVDAISRVPAAGAGAPVDLEVPWEEVPDETGTCVGAYGVRFSLAAEESVEPAVDRTEARVLMVRYKARRSWLWGPMRYDLTLVWASDELGASNHEAGPKTPSGNWTPSEQAETQLASGIPSSIELEVEFDPNHSSCATLFDGNSFAMASSFVDQVATLIHHDADLQVAVTSETFRI